MVSVPASPDRYYVLQWFDLYTHNFAYIGSRATGTEAGDYMFAGPGWNGEMPKGIKQVLNAETQFIGTLTRTAWTGPEDRDGLVAMQRQYRIRPLSEYTGSKPPEPAPIHQYPAWDEARANSIGFIDYLNFILQFTPPIASERAALIASLGSRSVPAMRSMRQNSTRKFGSQSRPASRRDRTSSRRQSPRRRVRRISSARAISSARTT